MDQNYQSYSDAGAEIPPVEVLPPAPQKRGPSVILIVVIVLLLLCCCCFALAAVLYFWLGDMITDSLGITQWLGPMLFSA
jgi:hypothetical protein